jgi:hypothetical protein
MRGFLGHYEAKYGSLKQRIVYRFASTSISPYFIPCLNDIRDFISFCGWMILKY